MTGLDCLELVGPVPEIIQHTFGRLSQLVMVPAEQELKVWHFKVNVLMQSCLLNFEPLGRPCFCFEFGLMLGAELDGHFVILAQ